MNARLLAAAAVIALAAGLLRPHTLVTAQAPQGPTAVPSPEDVARLETHLADVRMLTDRGENAEAYFAAYDMIGMCEKPASSMTWRRAATRPSIMSEGATMSAPARAWLSAWRASSSSVSSL